MLEELKKNMENEKKIISDINLISQQIQTADENEKRLYSDSLKSLMTQLNILNDSVPSLLNSISPAKKLVQEVGEGPKDITRFAYTSPSTNEKKFITINKKDKDAFVDSLKLSEGVLVGLKKADVKSVSEKPSIVAHYSNRLFLRFSERFSPKLSGLADDLRKSNIRFLPSTYISIALFISLLAFILSAVAMGVLIFIFNSLLIWFWIPFAVVGLALLSFYLYPALEKGSVEKEVSYELPFAAIYMSAIAGSNIEPVKIFKIISNSKEYPTVGKEIRKMLMQIEIYGYDLVTALKNSARQTPNKKLSELFSGMATNIVSGGDLKNYLEKKAENFLLDYKLERQRYSSVAETFMDIYISILVAAPLILMMMLVVMNIASLNIGLTMDDLAIMIDAGVVIVNIIFLVVLQIKQPKT